MKLPDMLLLVFLLSANLGAHASTDDLNPITRVVQLLQGLAEKLEADGKAEEDLFDKYVCWAQTTIKEKTATNAAAKDRIDALEAYIEDIESGKIEFTTERADLEKLIEKLNKEIKASEDRRDKEKKDWKAAEKEMKQAIAALEEAIKVLDEATLLQAKGSLLSVKREVQTFQQEEHSGASMAKAIQLGERYLSKGDANFLKKLLTGDVSQGPDFKKLGKKATFKMKYKARSGKIQRLLKDMLKTFEDNLSSATNKEDEAADSFEKLMDSKKDELSSAEDALAEGSKEGATKGMAKEEAEKEVEDLKEQVKNDKGFIKDTEAALKDMKDMWKERKKLRLLEIKSINEAIAILNSDDAKDTMRSSFKSQGYLLIQKSTTGKIRRRVSDILREAGAFSKDSRLSQLAIRVLMQKGHFDKVLEAIDKLVSTLKDEEAEDLENKEDCESTREDDTKEARVNSLAIDDSTEEIDRQKTIISDSKEQIELLEEKIKKMKEDLKEAERQREDEKKEFEASKADDEAAVELIQKAMDVLKAFREDNDLGLVQQKSKGKRKQAPEVEAGKAPPPPPETGFDKPYEGAKGESNGIQSILGMIKEDVEKDIKKAEKEEKEAIEAYKQMVKDTEAEIESAESSISDHKDKIAKAEEAVGEEEEKKTKAKKTLDSIMESIKEAEPGCNFITVNFELRIKNRQIEIDGLLKAKSILQGAVY